MGFSPDSSSVEQAELQIRTLLGEVAQLSQLDISPDEFHAGFLRRIVMALGAVGAALWILDRTSLSLAYQINFKELVLPDEVAEKHTRLIKQMLDAPETGTILPPNSGTEETGNPTEHLLIFSPIRTELEPVGLVEIIHHADAPPSAQKSFLLFLVQVCRFANDYYKNRQLRHFGERQNLWTVLEEFTQTIHRSLNPQQTAYTIANEGRRLVDCDRVSVGMRRGNTCPITAVSGQDSINKRSATVRLLGALSAAVLKAGEPILYTGDTADFPPQIERAIEAYVDESSSKMIMIQPLFQKQKEELEEHAKQRKRPKPFGVLIAEQIEDSKLTEQTRKRIEIVAEHAGSALGNALEHHGIFLLPLWKMLGKSQKLVFGEMLPKTVIVCGLIAAVFAVLLFLPWKFQIHCTGTAEPILRQRIYSPIDAEIKQLFVDHNSSVEGPSNGLRGTTLLELRSPNLEAQKVQLDGEAKEIIEQLDSLTRMLQDQDNRLTDYERADLVGQRQQAVIRLETVQRQLHIFEQMQKPDLYITSPMDGVVISWDLRRRLVENRPISRMQYVMEIADVKGPWQLELLVPEKRMGYIMEQQKRFSNEPIRVEFVLASAPAVKHFGTVTEIHDRAEVRSDSGSAESPTSGINTVAVKVALENQEFALHPGTACNARIDCGKRPLGYVLFYEVIAFVQKNVLFRWF